MSRGTNGGKTLLKSVSNAVKIGKGADVIHHVKKWSNGENEPLEGWDLVIGAAIWNRCADQGITTSEEELDCLDQVYQCLVQIFIRESHDKENYMDRFKVFGATLKFFALHKRINLVIIEELLQEVSKTSFHARQKDPEDFKRVCSNFYAHIWNYMRENNVRFDLMTSLNHASLSIRWLVVLGLDQFQDISNKLSQISFLLVRNHIQFNTKVADFFSSLSSNIVDLMKQTIMDDAKNGKKVKKTKSVLPVVQFYGLLNITFVFTRQLVLLGDYEKALKVFRPITSVAKCFFEVELTEVWKRMVDAYVKIGTLTMNGTPNTRLTDELINSSESFRECRKQILDMKFQKAYPGYAFAFMYAFTESIGHTISTSKNNCSGSVVDNIVLLKQLPLSKFVKFLKEIQFAADACVGLDNMKSGQHILEVITEARKIDVESNVMFHVLRLAADKISDRTLDICKDLQQITESSYSFFMTVANRECLNDTKSAELYNLLTSHTCNIGYAYQKRKNCKEAMRWCYRSIDAYEAFRSKHVEMELKFNPLQVGLLLADCHRQLGEHVEGLRWLSKWLILAPQYVSSQSSAYDIYEQIPWSNWSVHWLGHQKEICAENPEKCRTVVYYMEENDPASVSDMFASKVLRLEMNSYFSGRQTLIQALLTVGQELEKNNFCLADKVLGIVSQAVGLWWLSDEESLSYSIALLDEAVQCLDELPSSKKGDGSEPGEEALRVYLSGVVVGWRALAIMKMNQSIAEKQLDALKEKVLLENPEKKSKVADGYAIAGFTNLTVEDEMKWATGLVHSAECFYQLSQMEDVFKAVADQHCPALAQVTIRFVSLVLSALGDKISSVKAWFSMYTIAKLYDRKGLTVLAASEILKLVGCATLECVQYAEQVNKTAHSENLIKHNRAVYHRLDLAKAVACHHNKNYEEGLKHLVNVHKFLSEQDKFDSTHHLMADADFVLSLYRSASLNLETLKLPNELPERCKMTPAGLTVKSYKLLGGLSREIDVLNSGWTDVFHNYYLLGSIAELSCRTVELLKETGKLRDLKCFISDGVYFMQRIGMISRSISLVVPLIELDIAARNFYHAQIRIATIANLYQCGSYQVVEESPSLAAAKKFLEKHLKIPGLSINRLENVSNLKWNLGDIDVSPFHYRDRSQKIITSLKKDCEEIDLKSMEMKAPSFLRHPLTCTCYTCTHLEIIPTALEFLAAQAKFAVGNKRKISMAILELNRLHHQRAMFRILFNMDYFTEQLLGIMAKKTGLKLLHTIYTQFFFQPGYQMQLTNMEMCPVEDISHIVHLMTTALRAVDIVDSQDYVLKSFAVEIGTTALYEYFVSSGRIPILDGNLRDIIKARIEQQEKENNAARISPDVVEIIPPSPPVVRKRAAKPPISKQPTRKATITSIRPRRILNNKSQHQDELTANVELVDLTKVGGFEDEDRHIPVIPPPNFDDSNDIE